MKNIERLREIYSEAFPDESKIYIADFIDRTSEDNIFTYEQSGEIVSVVYVVDKRAKFACHEAVMPYLAAIATKLEFRGKSIVKYPISKALEYLYKRGDMFVALYPFNHNYYTRFDFCDVSYCLKSAITGGKDFAVRVATSADTKSMKSIAEKACRGKYFHQVFDTVSIENMLNDYTIDGDKVYIISENGDDFAFFGVSGTNIVVVVTSDYDKFNSSNYLKGYEYARFDIGEQPYIQARIVNAREVLRKFWHLLQPNTLYRLTDNLIEQNNFYFAIVSGELEFYDKYNDCCSKSAEYLEITIITLCRTVWNAEKVAARNFFYDKY